MLVADERVGNVAEGVDPGDDALRVTLSDTERRRSRVRTTAADGTDLGIVVPDVLSDGDVLSADGRRVVVSLEAVEAMVLTFDAPVPPAQAVEVGHAVGNRHWDLAVEGDRVLMPVADDRDCDRMEAFVRPLLPDAAAVSYETVPQATFDDGHAGGRAHPHSHDGSHSHDHDAGRDGT